VTSSDGTCCTAAILWLQARFFSFIPAGGSGDFNVDLLEVRLRMIVVLRNTKQVRFGVQLPAMNNKMILEGKVTGPRNHDTQE
jgi:hypothetical protein